MTVLAEGVTDLPLICSLLLWCRRQRCNITHWAGAATTTIYCPAASFIGLSNFHAYRHDWTRISTLPSSLVNDMGASMLHRGWLRSSLWVWIRPIVVVSGDLLILTRLVELVSVKANYLCSQRRHFSLNPIVRDSYSHVRGSDLHISYSVKISYLSEVSWCVQLLCTSLGKGLYEPGKWLKNKYSLLTW